MKSILNSLKRWQHFSIEGAFDLLLFGLPTKFNEHQKRFDNGDVSDAEFERF